MSPFNSNSQIFTLQVKTILLSQFTNIQLSFLFGFFFSICVLSIFLKKCSFFSFIFFFFLICCVQQCSSFFSFLPCPFSIILYLFFFFFSFFFHYKLLIHCPFFNLIATSLCLYLNTITIGSLPCLFNFNPYFPKISQVYNKTSSIAYEYSSFFLTLKYPGSSFLKQPKLLSIRPTTFSLSRTIQKPSPQIFSGKSWSRFCAYLKYLISKTLFQNSKITFSKPQIEPHSRGNSTNQSVLQYHRILKSIHKISSTTISSNFLNSSLEETPTKLGMASISTQNRFHNTSKFTTIETCPKKS